MDTQLPGDAYMSSVDRPVIPSDIFLLLNFFIVTMHSDFQKLRGNTLRMYRYYGHPSRAKWDDYVGWLIFIIWSSAVRQFEGTFKRYTSTEPTKKVDMRFKTINELFYTRHTISISRLNWSVVIWALRKKQQNLRKGRSHFTGCNMECLW